MRTLLLISILTPSLFAGEVWVFLKDGTVCWGDPAASPLQLRVSGGKVISPAAEDIRYQRTREEVDLAVTQMIADIAKGKNIDQHTKRFVVINWAAAAKLLEFLKKSDPQQRLTALFALQYCWSPDAAEPVLRCLKENDKDIQKAAWQVLFRNIPDNHLAKLVKPLADDEDTETATIAFEVVDKFFPDDSLKRIQRMLREPKSQLVAIPRISHYRSPKLTPDTLALLNSSSAPLLRGGVVGLISQLADSDAARKQIQPLLADANAELREIAAEYYTWLGRGDDVPGLRRALEQEKDAYTRASLEGAIRVIENRASVWAKDTSLAAELKQIRETAVLEPTYVYKAHEHNEMDAWVGKVFRLQEVLGAPVGKIRDDPEFLSMLEMPAAQKWLPPIRDYYDTSRKSFGFCVTQQFTAFVGSVHVGDDCGWSKELRTVVSIAPGIVRSVSHSFSWGFIVVVEHQPAGESPVCSLYAHLSPMLHVKVGDMLKAGQKIGSTGRSYSVENGGYNSHLHFGLHKGGYGAGAWVCGYIKQKEFSDGADGWIDPQAFLRIHEK